MNSLGKSGSTESDSSDAHRDARLGPARGGPSHEALAEDSGDMSSSPTRRSRCELGQPFDDRPRRGGIDCSAGPSGPSSAKYSAQQLFSHHFKYRLTPSRSRRDAQWGATMSRP